VITQHYLPAPSTYPSSSTSPPSPCTITKFSQSFQAPEFPLQSVASTSKFYWELLVYIVDPKIKLKKKERYSLTLDFLRK
jgi:hypothetical protein